MRIVLLCAFMTLSALTPLPICKAEDSVEIDIKGTPYVPEADLFRSLGRIGRRWDGIYTPFIADESLTIPLSNIMLKSDSGEMLSGYVLTDDARLTDARTPLPHADSHVLGGADSITPASIGAVDTRDPRLTDARTPASHSASHSATGNDPLLPEDIGAMTTAPPDGKSYLAVGTTWVAYTEPETMEPGVSDHTQLSHRDAPDQHPQSAITGLAESLANKVNANDQRLEDARTPISHAATHIPKGSDPLTGYATIAELAEAVAKAGSIVGEIRLMPFRKADLPDGWYYPSGDYFELTSVVGKALNSLPANYKSDWGITVSGSSIRLFDPNKFFAENMGRFFRPVNDSNRLPGSIEGDAIRKIAGVAEGFILCSSGVPTFSGALGEPSINWAAYIGHGAVSGYWTSRFLFDSSYVVPTANENRPSNVGLIPAIYLGQ